MVAAKKKSVQPKTSPKPAKKGKTKPKKLLTPGRKPKSATPSSPTTRNSTAAVAQPEYLTAWQSTIEKRISILEESISNLRRDAPSSVSNQNRIMVSSSVLPKSTMKQQEARADSMSTADPFDIAAPPRPSTLPPPITISQKKPKNGSIMTRQGRPVTVGNESKFPPCASKYHTRYSSNEQHGTKECKYCRTCHVLEVLFNQGQEDCKWGGHKLCPSTVSKVLKDAPASVLETALQRSELFRLGTKLQVMRLGGI